MRKRHARYLVGLGCIIAAAVAFFVPTGIPGIASFVIIFTILAHGYFLGCSLAQRAHWIPATGLGVVLFLAIQSVVQAVWYYATDGLGPASDLTSLVAGVLIAQYLTATCRDALGAIEPVPVWKHFSVGRTALTSLLLAAGGTLTALVLHAASDAATMESIRTPWPLLPDWTLAAIAGVWLTLLLSAVIVRSPTAAAVHAALAVGVTTAIAPFVYRIGFGFDGFLHVASEKILLTTGTLTPKPLYYIGQYVFTTWFSRAADIGIADVDRWLVPVAAALLLPLIVLVTLRREARSAAGFLCLGLVPLAGFVATTPQGFAYILGFAALLLCIGVGDEEIHPLAPLFLATWSTAVHPLAGIPLIFIVGACILVRKHRLWATALAILTILLAGASVPFMFWALDVARGFMSTWDFDVISTAGPWIARVRELLPWIGNRFALWPAWSTLMMTSLPALLFAGAIAGFVAIRRRTMPLLAGAALALFAAAVVLKGAGDFAFLIDYERGNYADRLNTLAILCLAAAVLPLLPYTWDRLRAAPRIVAACLTLATVGIATGLAYDSLPRHDALVTGRGWTVSRHDMEAVRLIDRDADGRDYAVLANQSVSAAAVATLGFKRYVGDVFFYPIPTGGPLYETYLRMTYGKPSRDTVEDAADLAAADIVYVVLNDYWWRSQPVAESIAAIADEEWDIGGDPWKLKIYRFDINTDSNAPTETSTR
ncbi:hypothetical protein KJ781_02745 [Patescibacteria group bacterium]|nr:hypothetical protein [Patescibacteria group bacterium]MBU1448835.1 hypothetical protein [Patescibacteria group bacterium]MBU2613225.1 hypothetical protein [Patescibacteria group bacterium]